MSKESLDCLIKRLLAAILILWSFVVIWAVTMQLHEANLTAAKWFGFALWILLGVPTGIFIMCLLMSLTISDNGEKDTYHKNTYTSPKVIEQRGILGSITCPLGDGSYPEGERQHHKNDAYNHKDNCPVVHKPSFHRLNPFVGAYRLLRRLSTRNEENRNSEHLQTLFQPPVSPSLGGILIWGKPPNPWQRGESPLHSPVPKRTHR